MANVIGIDVGGTFTDCVLYDSDSGTIEVRKVPTTPGDEARGLLNGIGALDVTPRDVELVVHGFTTATNAVIQRKGAVVGLITTAGFRDILELRRRDRPQTWGMRDSFVPLVPRRLRLEIAERMSHTGKPLVAPRRDEVERVVADLLKLGVEAVAVSFLHAYTNPAHEQQVAAWVRELWPNEYVVAGSEVLGEWREFERTSTAVVNAYVQPVVSSYLLNLRRRLDDASVEAPLLLVRSNGGLMPAEDAARAAVHTILSGPAVGVSAAAALARAHGIDAAISYDMGGTSLDVSLILDGRVQLTNRRSIEFGLPVHVPQADIDAIGAGGGSIAWIDSGGFLRVGPQSAGAEPGPAAYCRGGTEPTVTDAHIALGIIDPELAIGSSAGVRLNRDASLSALEQLGRRLQFDALATAEAVLEVANTKMVGALRAISVQRGHDPRRFVLIPFGGGGGIHACALTRMLGAAGAIVPPFPGVMSAIGCVFADLQHETSHTINRPVESLGDHDLADWIAAHVREGAEFLGADAGDLTVLPRVEMNYQGQTHTITVPLSTRPTREEVAKKFEERYRLRFGRTLAHIPAIVEALQTTVVLERSLDQPAAPRWEEFTSPFQRRRTVHFGGTDVATEVRHRSEISSPLEGPLIIVQSDSTIFIEPGFRCRPLMGGTLMVERS